MVQDIAPHSFDNGYHDQSPSGKDTVFVTDGERMLARLEEDGSLSFPKYRDFAVKPAVTRYLFRLDNESWFAALDVDGVECPGFEWVHAGKLRGAIPHERSFAGVTAMQLFRWYRANVYCGCCGESSARTGRNGCSAVRDAAIWCTRKFRPVSLSGLPMETKSCLPNTPVAGTIIMRWLPGSVRSAKVLRRQSAVRFGKKSVWRSTTSVTGAVSPGRFLIHCWRDFSVMSKATRRPIWSMGNCGKRPGFSREEIPVHDDGVSLTRALIAAFQRGDLLP